MKAPFIGQAYENKSILVSSQRCINWYPEIDPDPQRNSRNVICLQPAAGLKTFKEISGNPVNGFHFAEQLNLCFAVVGDDLYSLSSSKTATLLSSGLKRSGLVSIANNGTQVAIATGAAGYIYSASGGLTEVTNLGAVKKVVYQDGYFVFATATGQQFRITSLLDGTVVDPLDVASAESAPDSLVGLEQFSKRLWLMGANGYEAYSNTGAADFPFQVVPGSVVNGFGLAGTFASVVADGTGYFCSNDGKIYRINGYSPEPISHYGIENSLRTYSTLSDCEATAWTENGHRFIAFSFPSGGETWVFDSGTSMWHQRSTGTNGGIWSVRFVVKAFGKNLVADRNTGRIGEMDLDIWTEYGDNMMARRTTPITHGEQRQMFISRLELVMEAGTVNDDSDPQVRLSWSNDGGYSYGNEVPRSLGKIGEYRNRAVWQRLGRSVNRPFDVQITDNVPRVFVDAVMELEVGDV